MKDQADQRCIDSDDSAMNGMEVAAHIVSEQDGTPRVRDDESCGTSDEQMHGKPNRLGCDEDVERGVVSPES